MKRHPGYYIHGWKEKITAPVDRKQRLQTSMQSIDSSPDIAFIKLVNTDQSRNDIRYICLEFDFSLYVPEYFSESRQNNLTFMESKWINSIYSFLNFSRPRGLFVLTLLFCPLRWQDQKKFDRKTLIPVFIREKRQISKRYVNLTIKTREKF